MSKTRHPEPLPIDNVPHWDIETDVAIVGFGGAGACAAIEAAEAGAAVALFELSSTAGGSTALAGGEFYLGGNGGTPVQRSCGFDDSTEAMRNYLTRCAGEQADNAKIDAYCEGAIAHFNWLVAHGIPFKNTFFPTS